jgi:hypothetical protein
MRIRVYAWAQRIDEALGDSHQADRLVALGVDLCPVCGIETHIIGETLDGRLIGACQDAFSRDRWNDDPESDADPTHA